MVTNSSFWPSERLAPDLFPTAAERITNWYALHTHPRHEKRVVQQLTDRGVEAFLPLVTEVHRWSDRKKAVQLPLFSCYVFANFISNRVERLRLQNSGDR